MRNLEALRDQWRAERYLGGEIAGALLAMSNSPRFVIPLLEQCLTAARADYDAERAANRVLFRAMKAGKRGGR